MRLRFSKSNTSNKLITNHEVSQHQLFHGNEFSSTLFDVTISNEWIVKTNLDETQRLLHQVTFRSFDLCLWIVDAKKKAPVDKLLGRSVKLIIYKNTHRVHFPFGKQRYISTPIGFRAILRTNFVFQLGFLSTTAHWECVSTLNRSRRS